MIRKKILINMGTYYPKKEQRETPVYKMFRQKYLGSWINANMNEQKDGMTISERREIIVKILPRIMEKILLGLGAEFQKELK